MLAKLRSGYATRPVRSPETARFEGGRHCTPPCRGRDFAAMPSPSASAPVQFAQPRAGAPAFDVITVDNLSKRFGEFWALRGASFSIRRGEILGLIGPNGSGKTTLFQCFAGLAPATLGG